MGREEFRCEFYSSPQDFTIIVCRPNGFELHSSTLFCPARPPPLTPTLSISLLHESFHLVFYLPLRLFSDFIFLCEQRNYNVINVVMFGLC